MTPVRGKRGKLIHLVAFGVGRDRAPEELPIVLCGVRLSETIVEPDAEVTCWRCQAMQNEIATYN